jgi:hypothetical protein
VLLTASLNKFNLAAVATVYKTELVHKKHCPVAAFCGLKGNQSIS